MPTLTQPLSRTRRTFPVWIVLRSVVWLIGCAMCSGATSLAAAQAASQPAAEQAVRAAVQAEMAADINDKSNWTYRDHDATPEKDAVYFAVETPQGSLRRMIELGRQPLTPAQRQAEDDRIAKYVNSPDEQAKKRKDGAHDDAQAAELLHMLPDAFVWTVAEESPEAVTLDFRPNPAFHPPDMQSRVLGSMAGQLVVARDGDRIRTLRGKLTQDVKIGLGILGKLDAGGTFDVERREIVPGRWQITETHVHIGGHALLFKSIGQQEDEVKTDWHPSTAKTLHDAEEQLRSVK